jgi:thiamine-phosphate pyrophosphorylase
MPNLLPETITYLVTGGETTRATGPSSEEFRRVLALVSAAVAAGVTLVQLREKRLAARTLYELAARAADLARGTRTRVLVNDRADIARAALCGGVHLTAQSLPTPAVRESFGADFFVGVSAHSFDEAHEAREQGADFAVLGPVFDTPSKRAYGPPLGLGRLREAAERLAPFPVVAIGGVNLGNVSDVLRAGARGVAAIRLFADGQSLREVVHHIESLRAA